MGVQQKHHGLGGSPLRQMHRENVRHSTADLHTLVMWNYIVNK